MIIKEYQSKEEIRASYYLCDGQISPLFERYYSISFGEYDIHGNTIVFHIFYKLSDS